MVKSRTKKIQKHVQTEAVRVLEQMKNGFPDIPGGMEYFYSHAEKQFSGDPLTEKGKKIVATTCLQVPEELVIAAGARPLRICSGSSVYENLGAESLPAKSCSLVKAIIGSLQMEGPQKEIGMLVVPTTCDQKTKSVEMLRDMGYNVYPLSLPSRKDNEISRNYWQNSVKEFAVDLMKFTGKKISSSGLRKAISLKNRARNEYRRFYNLRKSVPAAIFGKDAFLVTDAYFTDDRENWTEALRELNDELELKVSSGEGDTGRPRFLFTGSPPVFPNLKIPLLVEELGGLIAIDEVCSSSRILYDMPYYEEGALYDMVPAVADTYLKPCTCPCFALNEERKDKIRELIEHFSIDGVIYQAFSGCNLFEMEQRGIGNLLNEMKVPLLYMESDYSREDTGQLTTRIEAFIESVKIKKRKKRKN